ncbi:MAG: hypothetical protein KF754_14405 [Planctomycetes bacterium]|nr:hypothetical protein [Planctomycetota bacterium]
MALWKKVIARSDLLVPAGVLAGAALIGLDVLAYHLLGLRPLVSYPGVELALYAVLIASAWAFAARWLLSGERRAKVSLAASITVMLALSALHPYGNGSLREVALPAGEPALVRPGAAQPAMVEYTGGPFTQPREKQA